MSYERTENDGRDGSDEEARPLLERPSPASNASSMVPIPRPSIVRQTILFGLPGIFYTGTMVGNAKLLSMLSETGGAAAFIIPVQGTMLAIATCLSTAAVTAVSCVTEEENKDQKTRDIIKTGWILIAGLGALGSGMMLLTRPIFPHLFNANTSQAAISFFESCAIGNIPLLMLTEDTLIALTHGDWYIPAIIGASFCAVSLGLGYSLAFDAELGAFGVGLGNSVGALLAFAFMRMWFTREPYKKYGFYELSQILEWKQIVKTLAGFAWKPSLQRLIEWSNLLFITTAIGLKSNDALEAMIPSMQFLGLFISIMQPVAIISGRLIANNNSELDATESESVVSGRFSTRNDGGLEAGVSIAETPILQHEPVQIERTECLHKNTRTLLMCSSIAVGLTTAFTLPVYFARTPIAKFFHINPVNSTVPMNTLATNSADTSLAETLLCINLLGLFPDAVRTALTGGLGGWKAAVFPIITNLITMIIVALPLGLVIGDKFGGSRPVESSSAWMFSMRDIGIFLSALIMVGRCIWQLYNAQQPRTYVVADNRNGMFASRSPVRLSLANGEAYTPSPGARPGISEDGVPVNASP